METNWCGMISYYGNPINFRAALGINQSWQATLVVFYFCNNSCSSPWNDLSLITADRNEDHGRHSAMYVCRSAPRGEDASWSRWAPTPAPWFGCWDFVALGEEVFLWGLLPSWWWHQVEDRAAPEVFGLDFLVSGVWAFLLHSQAAEYGLYNCVFISYLYSYIILLIY